MARLVQKTEHSDVAHELLFGSTAIGRGKLNDIVVADPGERRVHAEVTALRQGHYAILDKGSRGGVTVNGEPVEGQRVLAPGDVVAVGATELVFELGEQAPPTERPAEAPARRKGLLGGVLRLTSGTLLSRALGLVREMVAMAWFGASGAFDAFVAATTLPNLFRDVLGEHAAESAFMPAHKTLMTQGREAEARRLATSVLAIVVAVGVVLVALGMAFAPSLMAVVVPGFAAKHPELWDTTASLARWMMPFLLIIAVGAVFGSLLLSDRRFLRYAIAPAGASVTVILAIVLLTGRLDVWSMAVGVVVGGLVQAGICAIPYLRPGSQRLRWERPLVDTQQPALRRVARGVVPIAMSGVLNKLIWVVDRALASWFCDLGRISALYVAHRLLQLPFGVVGLAVGRAAFPSLIEEASSREGDGFSQAVVRAMRLNVFLMVPAMVALMVLGVPLVRVLCQRGAFTADHTQWVALALVCYSVGLVGMGMRTVLSRAFYALLNTRTPFVMSAVACGTNVVLSVALVVTPLGHGGLALASSFATWLQVGLLLAMLGREVARQGRHLSLAGLGSGLMRMAASGAAMALCTWGALMLLAGAGLPGGLVGSGICLVVPGAVGVVVYFGVASVLGCDESAEMWARLRKRRG